MYRCKAENGEIVLVDDVKYLIYSHTKDFSSTCRGKFERIDGEYSYKYPMQISQGYSLESILDIYYLVLLGEEKEQSLLLLI